MEWVHGQYWDSEKLKGQESRMQRTAKGAQDIGKDTQHIVKGVQDQVQVVQEIKQRL